MDEAFQGSPNSSVTVPQLQYFTETVHHDIYARSSPSRPELSAHGKNVVVTGGGTGIGKSMALSFVLEGANATATRAVVIEKTTDSTKHEQADAAFNEIAEKFGKVDILVSNAAVLPRISPVATYGATEMMNAFELNVVSAMNAVQRFLSVASEAPIILNVSSAVAHISPMQGIAGYSVSKAANLKMMDYFAVENTRVHVFSIQLGAVETEMSSSAGVEGLDSDTLPGHFSVWLASPEARFLRNKFVWANWDVDELMARSKEIETSRLFTWGLEGVPM